MQEIIFKIIYGFVFISFIFRFLAGFFDKIAGNVLQLGDVADFQHQTSQI